MFRVIGFLLSLCLISASALATEAGGSGVRVGDLARLATLNDTALVGYSIVTGLAGTGDSPLNEATMQSVRNMLLRFGLNVEAEKVRARNSAAVMVTSTLPPYSQPGDKLDVNVTSIGDARSLVGGTLILTPLAIADREIYAMAQGPLSVGGFSYDLNGTLVQKNHPTAANIPDGATVNRLVDTSIIDASGMVLYKLYEPDFETVNRIVDALNVVLGPGHAKAKDAARVEIFLPEEERSDIVRFLTKVEKTEITPSEFSRVVVNERTGTVVSGGNVVISPITVSHGNLRVAINTEFFVSQPFGIGNTIIDSNLSSVQTEVVPETTVDVTEDMPMSVSLPQGSKVVDLVTALNKLKATSRDIITILQGIKRAGALHAELIIQ